MEFGDFIEPEIGVAVAVTAAAASPSVRKTLRKGAVYGLAGLMLAGDAAMRFARSVGQGARNAGHTVASAAEGAAAGAREGASEAARDNREGEAGHAPA